MADYASFLYNAFGGVGDAIGARRQEKEGVRQYDQNFARTLDNDQWRKDTDSRDYARLLSRDQVGDSQWERGFGADQSYRNRSLSLQEQKLQQDKASGSDYGLNPVWGTDAQGNPALVQLGKNGQPIQPQLPEGFKIARDPVKMDAGTHFVLLDPQTRQQIGTIPKDVAGEEQAKVEGKNLGEAQASLPKAIGQAENMLASIRGVRDDPYRSRGTGFTSIANNIPATGGYDFQQKVDQLKGQSFLQAFESLKGAGQISEVEGQTATKAIARLNTAQSEEAFGQALNELETVVQAGMNRARQRASGQQPQGADEGWTTMSNGVRMRQVR